MPNLSPIIQAVWSDVAPKTALAPPSAEAKKMLSCKSINVESGDIGSGKRGVSECFRIDARGRIIDTQNKPLESSGRYAKKKEDDAADLPQHGHQALDRVGAAERAPQLIRQTQADHGEHFIQPFAALSAVRA